MLWVYKITYIHIHTHIYIYIYIFLFAKNRSLPPCQMIAKATFLVMCLHTHLHLVI